MKPIIEVRIGGRGNVRDGHKHVDRDTAARCDLCGSDVDAIASVTADASGPFACKTCLRVRLEAITVALYELREPGTSGLPWGKVSG